MATFDEYDALLVVQKTGSVTAISPENYRVLVDRRGWVEVDEYGRARVTIKGEIEMARMAAKPRHRPAGVSKKT